MCGFGQRRYSYGCLSFPVRTRFSKEEIATLRTHQILFGTQILDFITVLFTGGDELKDNDKILEDYLGRECPVGLKDIIAAKQEPLLGFQ